ncbi:MAG: ATP-binding protein [Campylobacterales bacterium]
MDFKKARELFRDVVETEFYVPLPSQEKVKIDLISTIRQQEKIVLLTGEAGSGKSMILKKIYEELKDEEIIFFVSNPYSEIEGILDLLRKVKPEKAQTFLIDEAQLLSAENWENLRIYADRGNVTLLFATHDTDIEKLLQKKHFKSRINYIIPTSPISFEETQNFILTKLNRAGLFEIGTMFRKSNFKKIYKFTKGSLRTTNQLMFKLFDVLDYFYSKRPAKVDLLKLSNKYIEIAIMDLKEFNA